MEYQLNHFYHWIALVEDIFKRIIIPKVSKKNLLKLNFFYFYSLLIDKNKTNLLTLYFFHIFEIMQLISFAFSYPHILTWKISEKAFEIINIVTFESRLTTLLRLISFNAYIIIFIIIFILIFAFSLLLIIQIIFRNPNSTRLLTLTHLSITPLTLFFYISMIELFLISLKSGEDKIFSNANIIQCWNGLFFVFLILGILGTYLIYFLLIVAFFILFK